MPFTFTPQALPEVLLVTYERFDDERGYFAETFRDDVFRAQGLGPFVQDNVSRSTQRVLRGLHFQREPRALDKLVRCARGRIFDVAVDIRRGSPTFRRFVALELDERENRMLYVPKGFAHGFCVLSESAEVVYKMTGSFSPAHDAGIAWDDPELGIPWPVKNPILSARDRASPTLGDATETFVYRPG